MPMGIYLLGSTDRGPSLVYLFHNSGYRVRGSRPIGIAAQQRHDSYASTRLRSSGLAAASQLAAHALAYRYLEHLRTHNK